MSKRNAPLELGCKARDRVTRFEGIVTAWATHLSGCDRLFIDPGAGEDGKLRDGGWFDLQCLERTGDGVIDKFPDAAAAPTAKPGGADLPPSARRY